MARGGPKMFIFQTFFCAESGAMILAAIATAIAFRSETEACFGAVYGLAKNPASRINS